MLKKVALAVFLALSTALSAGAPQNYELEIAEAVRKNPVVIVFRSTAKVFRVDWYENGSHDRKFFHGPATYYTFSPQRGNSVTLTAEWQDRDERYENHTHVIKLYHNGKLVENRRADGIGVMLVRLVW